LLVVPIATCFIRADLLDRPAVDEIVSLWSEEAGVGAGEMTVNVIAQTGQSGKRYAVMAQLHLPSLWSADDVVRLELGLARALSRGFGVDPADVQVMTSIVASGHVVEAGEVQEW
jgi:hypothetical protein